MQAYTRFAEVYDTFMDNVPYEEWASYLISLLKEYSIEDGVVLELGCGTGNLTRILAESGYDMIGIDNSYEMLEIARDREYEDDYYEGSLDYEEDDFYEDGLEYEADNNYEANLNLQDKNNMGIHINSDGMEPSNSSLKNEDNILSGVNNDSYSPTTFDEDSDSELNNYDEGYGEGNLSRILYLEQDMRDFELFGTVRAIVSICDSMNYITSEDDLLKVFTLANNYLDKGGMFIFDMNTEYKYKHILADNTIAENRDDCSFIWENYYDEEKQLNEYNVTIYVSATDELDEVKNNDGRLYERFVETHYQKAYSIEKVKELIIKAGLEFIAVYDAFTHNEPNETSERVYFITKEKEQKGKKYL
jgi:SAM-dependent methyltransferase